MKLGIVSDIHGQPIALKAALAAMEPVDQLICLGDSISQARFCNQTIALLRAHDALTILGNHEEAFFAGRGRNAAHVDADLADWLASRPSQIDLEVDGYRILVVHSTPWPSGHAYIPSTHPDFARFAEREVDVVLYGHTHVPLVQRIGNTLVINPGSVGEGRPTSAGFSRSCAVLDLADLTAEIIDLD